MAKDLEGVIRIGAVNCQEDWSLCNHQGIQSYPSLVLYPGVNTVCVDTHMLTTVLNTSVFKNKFVTIHLG